MANGMHDNNLPNFNKINNNYFLYMYIWKKFFLACSRLGKEMMELDKL